MVDLSSLEMKKFRDINGNQSRPISPGSLAGQFRFKEAGYFIVDVCLFSFSTRNIAIKTIISSHLRYFYFIDKDLWLCYLLLPVGLRSDFSVLIF